MTLSRRVREAHRRSLEFTLEADKKIEDRYDFDYDTGNKILPVAFM